MKSAQFIVLAGLAGMMAMSPARAQSVTGNSGAEKTVTYRTIGADDYQSFIGNWDEKKTPVLCASIRSSDDWDKVFHPAAVMGQKKKFGPEATVFDKEQLLIVARVMTAPKSEDVDKAFKVEKITVSGANLVVHYRYNDPAFRYPDSKAVASFTVKSFLGVFVPKHDYKKIMFVENGKTVGNLDLASGQWSVPAM